MKNSGRRIVLSVFFILVLFTTAVQADNAASVLVPDTDTVLKKIQQVFDNAAQNELLSKWLDRRINDSIKHGLDARVDQILRAHPLVRQINKQVVQMLTEETNQMRSMLLLSTAKAMKPTEKGGSDGQYTRELALVQQVSRQLNFPIVARKNAALYIMEAPVVNAFTYSGLPNTNIDLVLYKGIINLLSKEELKAVIGHEIGHIKSEHVKNQMLVIAIVLTSGELVIPDAPGSEASLAKTEAFKQNVFMSFKQMNAHKYAAAIGPIEEQILLSQFKVAEQISDLMKKSIRSKEEIFELAKSLGLELDRDEDTAAIEATAEVGKVNLTEEDVERILTALSRYSRSCEVSADRYGLLVTNVTDAENVDVRLLGGKRANSKAVLRQLEELARTFNHNPDLLEVVKEGQKTHPGAAARVYQYRKFVESVEYRTYSDPFFKSIDAYIGTSLLLDEIEREGKRDGHKSASELIDMYQTDSKRSQFQAFNDELRDVLIDTILIEYGLPPAQRNYTRFIEFVRYLQTMGFKSSLSNRMLKPKGLIFELSRRLRAISDDEGAKKSEKMLSLLSRSSSSLAREFELGKIKISSEAGIAFETEVEELRSLSQASVAGSEIKSQARLASNAKDCEALLLK